MIGAPALPKVSGYTIGTKVGEGAVGRVFFARRKEDRLPVALKFIDVDAIADDVSLLLVEQTNMSLADSEHVACLHDVLWPEEHPNTMVVVVEWVTGGNLNEVVARNIKLDEEALLCIAVDALLGLQHLHDDCHLVHRDVKGSNIMIGRDGVVKLSDFGSAGAVTGTEGKRLTTIGTPGWIAPEVAAALKDPARERQLTVGAPSTLDATANYRQEYRGDGYRYEADVWSLGTTLIELATGSPSAEAVRMVRDAAGEGEPIRRKHLRPAVKDDLSADTVRFIARMLDPAPAERGTAAELLEHCAVAKALRDPSRRREVNGAIAKQIPEGFSTSAGKAAKTRTDSDQSLDRLDDEGSASSVASSDTDSSLGGASSFNSAAAKDEPPSTCPTLNTTKWHIVNPSIVSLLRGKDVSLGASLNPEYPPAVYQRSRALAGLRAATRRDQRTAATEGGAVELPLGDMMTNLSQPFGPVFTHVVMRSHDRMWHPGLLPRSAPAPGDEATRQKYNADVAKRLAACEAAVPGFSARLLAAVTERAGAHEPVGARLQGILRRGLERTTHVDAMGATAERARGLGGPGHMASMSRSGTWAAGTATVFGSWPSSASAPPPGATTPPAVEAPVNLVVPGRDDHSAAPPAGAGGPRPASDLSQLAVVVTSAKSRGVKEKPAVDVGSFLFERWKADVARSTAPGRT